MTKSFVVVAAIFILVGGSIGGAFTGGVILGRNQAESEAPAAANFVPPEGFSSDQAAALRQMAGQLSQAGGASQSVSATSVRNTGATGNRTSQSVASGASQEAPVSADNAGTTLRWRRTGRLCRVWSRFGILRRGRNLWNHRFHRRRRRSHQHSPGSGGSRHKLGNGHPSLLRRRTQRPH